MHIGPYKHALMNQNSGTLAASTHMSVLSCPGHPEHVGASCHPAAGVQIQGGDGSHPPESGRPPDHHGGQRAQLPERTGRHPNGSLFVCLLVCPARRRSVSHFKALWLSRSVIRNLKKRSSKLIRKLLKFKNESSLLAATCVLLIWGPCFNVATGCVQGVSVPRPLGSQEWHGDTRPLPEAAFNQENICLLPRTHCQVLVQHGKGEQSEHIHMQPVLCNHPLWLFIRVGFLVLGGTRTGCFWPGSAAWHAVFFCFEKRSSKKRSSCSPVSGVRNESS